MRLCVLLLRCVCQMAMLTTTVLGTPNLGNSFTKAAQRIAGVMIGELPQHWCSMPALQTHTHTRIRSATTQLTASPGGPPLHDAQV